MNLADFRRALNDFETAHQRSAWRIEEEALNSWHNALRYFSYSPSHKESAKQDPEPTLPSVDDLI